MNICDFKDLINDLFPASIWDIILKDGVLIIKNKEIKKEFSLSDQDFNEIYNGLQKNKSGSNYELYTDYYYEAILIIDSRYVKEREEGFAVDDPINKINYKYDKISKELALSILLNSDSVTKRNFVNKLPLYVTYRRAEDVKSDNIIDLLSELALRYSSLKISTSNAGTLDKFRSYALSFTYTFMYNRQVPMHLYNDVQTDFRLSTSTLRNKDFDYPKKLYNPELVFCNI